jgi:hypothetical protein
MATRTFVMKKGGQPGIIPLGADRLVVEPGKPFDVEGDDGDRFEQSPDFDEVKDPPKPKADDKKDGDDK